MPYQRNPHFTGRDEVLQQIHRVLCEMKHKKINHRLAIYGMGGVGKTQIAIEYVHQFGSAVQIRRPSSPVIKRSGFSLAV